MCKHAATSYVTATHREFGDFITVQCDVCGVMLPKADIPDGVFDTWHEGGRFPALDIVAANRAVDLQWRRAVGDEVERMATVVWAVRNG